MAETIGSAGSGHPSLNLTAEEKKAYAQLLKEADPDGFGAVSGDVAVKFFERTKLAPDVLGQIWQIADTENRGFLTPAGFGVVLRLIGHAQAGRTPTAQIATQAAPLPRFEGSQPQAQAGPPPLPQQAASPVSPSQTGPLPIRVPALPPEKIAEYSTLFERSGPENGALAGGVAKQIFERAKLPNEVLGRIWALSDTQGRGQLDMTEFIIAMHLLASYKSGQMRGVPNSLPPGLYDAAARRPPPRTVSNVPFQPQATGFTNVRPQSPIVRQQVRTPLSTQSTGDTWLVNPADKARFDSIFATVDRQGRGFITGEQAVEFFGNSRLSEDVLAQIWDLADINSEGQLDRDEFAVAMYLIRQQRGSKDGQGTLPPALPPSLIPPSKRRQPIPPQQSTAPAFENAPITKPKSAADDLFGLDAFGPAPTIQPQIPQPQIPQPQIAQSTGGTDAGPFANPPAAAMSPATQFKPFVPSSTFGQSISKAQQPTETGATASRSMAPQHAASDDLLGDADPEVSSKLTNETSELANLSNQVGNLSKQMTDVQGQRGQTEQELSQNTLQKRAFEGRLAQLRSLYENEVKQVKTLQEQLTTSKNETKRLQSDMAVIEGSHQDLSVQHQQLKAALETDQRENASLKEKIRQMNTEVEQLKPQLEKLKSDARQQKGLVAINKKQLATNEGERDRIKAEIAAAQKQIDDATREAEESNRQLEASKRELEEARSIPVPTAPSIKSPPQVVSPAPSTSSNPFFRRSSNNATFSPPIAGHDSRSDNRSNFDSIFGPSFGTSAATSVPETSFRSESPAPVKSESSVPRSTESPASSVPADLPEPPPPAKSDQITSSALPFRIPLSRGDSISSSVKVAPPASRLSPAETPRALTPSTETNSPADQKHSTSDDPFTAAAADEEQESVRRTLPTAIGEHSHEEISAAAISEQTSEIPGAFPNNDTPRTGTPAQNIAPAIAIGAGAATIAAGAGLAAAVTANGEEDKGKARETPPEVGEKAENPNFDEYFGGPAHQRTASEQAADFDSAFAGMNSSNATAATNGAAKSNNQEFPAIQELDDDDDDSSAYTEETPTGFDDNFGNAPKKDMESSSTAAGKQPEVLSAVPDSLKPTRPGFETASSHGSSLPGFEQQKSPPTYGEVVPDDNPSHFPREYGGLLAERENLTSPPLPTIGGSTQPGPALAGEPPAYGPELGHATNTAGSPPPLPPKTSAFDFDSAFAGMAPAQVEDESDEEDAYKPSHHQTAEFDPTFDSPSNSRVSTANSGPTHSMAYNAVTNGASQPRVPNFSGLGVTTHSPGTNQSNIPSTSHDWDDIFSGLGSGPQDKNLTFGDELPKPIPAQTSFNQSTSGTNTVAQPVTDASQIGIAVSPPLPPPKEETSNRPQLGRALSTGTEHDDPILKRLTSMGWNREESLAALEKYDYNIDKAADYLTFRT